MEPGRARPPADVVTGPDEDLGPVPWHFKVFLAAASLYLGWRVVQVVGWFT